MVVRFLEGGVVGLKCMRDGQLEVKSRSAIEKWQNVARLAYPELARVERVKCEPRLWFPSETRVSETFVSATFYDICFNTSYVATSNP